MKRSIVSYLIDRIFVSAHTHLSYIFLQSVLALLQKAIQCPLWYCFPFIEFSKACLQLHSNFIEIFSMKKSKHPKLSKLEIEQNLFFLFTNKQESSPAENPSIVQSGRKIMLRNRSVHAPPTNSADHRIRVQVVTEF